MYFVNIYLHIAGPHQPLLPSITCFLNKACMDQTNFCVKMLWTRLFHRLFHSFLCFLFHVFHLFQNTKLDKSASNQNRNRHESPQTKGKNNTISIYKYSTKNGAQASSESKVNSLKDALKEKR